MGIFKKRLNLRNYLVRLILVLVLFLISFIIEYFLIEQIQLNNLYNTTDFNKLSWFDYYSLFHFNFLPLLLFIWFIILSIRRLHDCNKSSFFILFPIVNLYWLFSQGDAGENRFGNPQVNINHKNTIYFDELNKEVKKNSNKEVFFKLLIAVLFLLSLGLVFKLNTSNIALPQLFNHYDIDPDPISKVLKSPVDAILFNPLKSSKISGKIQVLDGSTNKNQAIFIFDKSGNLIREKTNDYELRYFYTGSILDSITEITNKEKQKITFSYITLKDSLIINSKSYKNNELYFERVLRKGKNSVEEVRNDKENNSTSRWGSKFNNFGLLSSLNDEEYEYDLKNNLTKIYDYHTKKLLYKFDYDINNRLISYQYLDDLLGENHHVTYDYSEIRLDNEKKPSINISGSFVTLLSEQSIDSTLTLGFDMRDWIVNNNTIYYEKDYKNNITKVIPSKVLSTYDTPGYIHYLQQEINRKYKYYDSYFGFFIKLIFDN
jgi:uncharacterized membrane protein YhaH (DUF805 family)